MKNITNIHAHGSPFAPALGISWTADYKGVVQARFHVWVDKETKQVAFDTGRRKKVLYMNPPKGVKSNEPGDFDTKFFDADAKAYQPIVASILTHYDRCHAEWEKEEGAKETARQEEQAASILQHQKEKAAERLYGALEAIFAAARVFKPVTKEPLPFTSGIETGRKLMVALESAYALCNDIKESK